MSEPEEPPFETVAAQPPQEPPFETVAAQPPQEPPFETVAAQPPQEPPGEPEPQPGQEAGQEAGQESRHDESGLDLARSIARGLAGRTGSRRRRSLGKRRVDPVASSAHPDDRDPQTLDATLGRFVAERGWQTELQVHGVLTRWAGIVGPEVAEHVHPESYVEGRLVVRTDSTAWATQMKLLAPDLVRRLNEELGDGTIEVIDVLGPHLPRWTSGRFRVKGRGPRDTFG